MPGSSEPGRLCLFCLAEMAVMAAVAESEKRECMARDGVLLAAE